MAIDKWHQLYLLIMEWREEGYDEEQDEDAQAFDAGFDSALESVLSAINELNNGKYPYELH